MHKLPGSNSFAEVYHPIVTKAIRIANRKYGIIVASGCHIKAAFEEQKEERKEVSLKASTDSLKRIAEEPSQLHEELPKRLQFCANLHARSGYGQAHAHLGCKFGHFTPVASNCLV